MFNRNLSRVGGQFKAGSQLGQLNQLAQLTQLPQLMAGYQFRALPAFNVTARRYGHELAPRFKQQKKKQKGRVSVRTGASEKGNTLQFGSYGMRLKTEGMRVKASQLQAADNVLVKFVKKGSGKLWRRLCTNLAVCIKGNATRMGKGKGPFDHWAARVPTGKVVFEVDGMHEQAAKDALRRACDKLPGVWEFIRKDTPARIGLKSVRGEDVPTVNYLERLKENPSKEYANLVKSREPEYKEYRGRK
ncbi:DEKNAAC103294 [Brettanomyces naardenensis]|uniref:DEKNAAC103294 n=1 Tax=Brettanomyces naardenensis TaxID=13370 RepID=A0A448YN38_BRENA|nr:DEKNAAC103294 [Brettanomyces naardenensis]